MILELIAAGIFSLFLLTFLRQDVPPLHGIYSQPGRWYHWKRWLLYAVLSWQQYRKKPLLTTGLREARKDGRELMGKIRRMDEHRPLPEHHKGTDAVIFNGVNMQGVHLMVGIFRRHGRKAEVWITIKIPGVGVLENVSRPATTVYNTDGVSFNAAGLRLECLEPTRRWRVCFNGLLRRGIRDNWHDDVGQLEHVRFSFSWEPFSDIFDFTQDFSPWLLSGSLAKESLTSLSQLSDKGEYFEHFGELRGHLQIGQEEKRSLNLRGARSRLWGVLDGEIYHQHCNSITHHGWVEDGTVYMVSASSVQGGVAHVQSGYVALPCGVTFPLTASSLQLDGAFDADQLPSKHTVSFTAGGTSYTLEVSAHETLSYYHGDKWKVNTKAQMCDVTLNGVKGGGFTTASFKHEGGSPVPVRQSVVPLREAELSTVSSTDLSTAILPFQSPACTSSQLVGGKGCQLAILSQMQEKDFVVPKGFCLTISAFQQQMKDFPHLSEFVQQIEAIASGRSRGILKEACETAVMSFQKCDISPSVWSQLEAALEGLYPSGREHKLFAVRSSAAGEDGVDMSAAGQMDTVLGVKTNKQMIDAIKQCWASHFAFPAVEYRRQHGQAICSTMGVVIQEMVASDVSGVLFTQDPLTGHPGRMTLNANFGLGESVVSGSSEPDSITVSRGQDDQLTISSRVVGQKKTQITATGDGGTVETEVESSRASMTCLPDEQILRLAQIGIQLENAFSDARDIEWAVKDDTIYLLQARPITTLGVETDEELLHEFDTPLASDSEILTTANIGEMMPMATTPLTLSTFLRATDYSYQSYLAASKIIERSNNLMKFQGICCNHAFINLQYMYGMCENKVLGSDRRMADLAVLGEVLDDINDEDVNAFWGGASFLHRLLSAICNRTVMYASYGRTANWQKELAIHPRLKVCDTAAEQYREITDNLPDYFECWADTVTNSGRSAVWSTVLVAILSQGKHEWNIGHYADVAMLLSKCEGVYSADVPAAIQELASEIRRKNKLKEFISMTSEEAVAWLESGSEGAPTERYKQFLRQHGHRCIREAEFIEKSWQTVPTKFVEVLQAILRAPEPATSIGDSVVENVEEAISKLKSPVTFIGKQILKRVVPRARAAVGHREWGKSISIEMVEKFKLAYWHLGRLLRSEGYLPDEELLFYLTHYEIGELISHRSGRLVARAQRRRRIHPRQMSLKFPRLNKGHPVPIDDSKEDLDITASAKLQGTPVSQGRVQGKARVIKSLQDAGSIQVTKVTEVDGAACHLSRMGEILVVRYTDVGWTPYFPLISGLVTEIGGLLSHGAVVAREYGIPCVVNAKQATQLVRTGDEVILDGSQGTLVKVE